MTEPLYEQIGGEDAVRRLVDAFYDRMDKDGGAAPIRAMHPGDLRTSRKKLFLFLSGWMGGPQLYIQRYGHPRLRRRHMPFAIGDDEAEQWMQCMRGALDECVPDEGLRRQLGSALQHVAEHMRNQGGVQRVGPVLPGR
jgi:hemoglobin